MKALVPIEVSPVVLVKDKDVIFVQPLKELFPKVVTLLGEVKVIVLSDVIPVNPFIAGLLVKSGLPILTTL